MTEYLKQMQELMLSEKQLLYKTEKELPENAEKWLARALTLNILRRLDGYNIPLINIKVLPNTIMKGRVIKFLYESQLIGYCSLDKSSSEKCSNLKEPLIRLADAGLDKSQISKSIKVLVAVDLSYSSLNGSDLSSVDLQESNFNNASLQSSNFKESVLDDANLKYANLTDANLEGTHLHSTELQYAHLTNADLTGAELTNANLTNANLTGADLTGADLINANLTNTELTNANFTNALLCGTNLTEQKNKVNPTFKGAIYSTKPVKVEDRFSSLYGKIIEKTKFDSEAAKATMKEASLDKLKQGKCEVD
jgi:uncharacterized protein YjbI with pentapeptide repeats